METIKGLKRTHYCGEPRIGDCGERAVVFGWVQRQRDLGKLIFIDLRDRTGIVQLAFDENTEQEIFKKAFAIRGEYVLAACGKVRERSSKNMEIPTGEVEIFVDELRILNQSETPPFEIVDGSKSAEELRLKYRYLDLRRPELTENIIMRHKIAAATREYFYKNGFVEIETPMLIKSTPEGARDFLVPSRIHRGSFYALPQSPQLYKQLSMVAGFDRYIQLARSFRDEDLRADRQPEFTQIDMEMSFVDIEDIILMAEGFVRHVFDAVLGIKVDMPIPRMTFNQAMETYGSDKPDTRYDMKINDISPVAEKCGFGVFSSAIEGGGTVRAITAKKAAAKLSRKEIDKLTEFVKGIGARGMAWVRMMPEGTVSSFGKFMKDGEMEEIVRITQAEEGDVIMILADSNKSQALSQLGSLRVEVAKRLELIPKDKFNFLWIVEMPFFELDEESGEWVAMHHPFTSPMDECLEYLESDKGKVRAKAYDLVLNGVELCSGSIRITDSQLQSRIFSILGLSQEQAQEKFGYLLEAFRYGAPPHGGMGLGLDRLVMVMLQKSNLRDVVAYPKLQNASEPMTQSPAQVDTAQLDELGISLKEKIK